MEQYDTWHQIIKQNSKRVFEAVNENEQAILMHLLGKIRQHINDDV